MDIQTTLETSTFCRSGRFTPDLVINYRDPNSKSKIKGDMTLFLTESCILLLEAPISYRLNNRRLSKSGYSEKYVT